jgi:hypothetical protein
MQRRQSRNRALTTMTAVCLGLSPITAATPAHATVVLSGGTVVSVSEAGAYSIDTSGPSYQRAFREAMTVSRPGL